MWQITYNIHISYTDIGSDDINSKAILTIIRWTDRIRFYFADHKFEESTKRTE